jgi:hypothetical protein
MDVQVGWGVINWIDLAQDKETWAAHLFEIMDPRVP